MYIGNPFKVLGVEDNADIAVCKKAYRMLCRKYHPDNGGDAEKYDAVNKAFKAIESKKYVLGAEMPKRHRLTHNTLMTYSVV